MGLIKTMLTVIIGLTALAVCCSIIGAFVLGMGEGLSNDQPASKVVEAAPSATQTKSFTPHSKYAEAYIPSINEIGDGKDWYMTKKETQGEGLMCTATYIKDEHRTVVITVCVIPFMDDAKTIYADRLADAPYAECPTMGVCDQSFQYVEEIPTHSDIEMYREVGTGVIRDGNIVVLFKVFEDNMFFGLNSYDMERYAKNIEKKINAAA